MRYTSLITAAFVALVTFSDVAGAQVVLQRQLGSTSKLVVKLVSGQVVEVNRTLGVFKLSVGKQAYTFTYAKLGHAPVFGDEVNVTYADNAASVLDAIKIKSVD
jgi:hypothetical protein